MTRSLLFLSVFALGCIDGEGTDSDSDTSTEPLEFDGTKQIFAVEKSCTSDTWTYHFLTDGLAGAFDIDVTQDQSVADPDDGWDEAHALDIEFHNPHWDGQGSPTDDQLRQLPTGDGAHAVAHRVTSPRRTVPRSTTALGRGGPAFSACAGGGHGGGPMPARTTHRLCE